MGRRTFEIEIVKPSVMEPERIFYVRMKTGTTINFWVLTSEESQDLAAKLLDTIKLTNTAE